MKTFNKTLSFLLKAVFYAVLSVILIIGVSTAYSYYKRSQSDATISELRKLEPNSKNTNIIKQLDQSKDQLGFLMGRLPSLSAEDTRLVISWLLNHEREGNLPYYYLISVSFAKLRNTELSLNYFELARLTSRLDDIRCNDKSSSGAYIALESTIFSIPDRKLKNNSSLAIASKSWAYTYEETVKNRKPAMWICMHGMNFFNGGIKLLSEDEWSKARTKYRVNYMAANIKELVPKKRVD